MTDDDRRQRRLTRRGFLGGAAAGVAGAWGASAGLAWLARDDARPPQLYEYFLDNFWFESVGLAQQPLNEPLRGRHKADIAIVGGGFTGLASAWQLSRRFPDKKILLLEGACCGYGASGRNGGFCDAGIPGLLRYVAAAGPELGRKAFDASLFGVNEIRRLVTQHGVACDFEDNGMLEAAIGEEQARALEDRLATYRAMGLEGRVLQGRELEAEVRSPRYTAALLFPYGAILNPAKLARGMKPLVEAQGVVVHERTPVLRVEPGRRHRIVTELGEVEAPTLVLGLDGYAPGLGFFRNRVLPLCNYVIATAPLTRAQWESIGWSHRRGIADLRTLFDYQRPTADGRIVIGGSQAPYFANDGLSTGAYRPAVEAVTRSFFATFPQLEGLRIDHAWGGTMGFTLDFTPSVGVVGEYRNIYYGVAYNGEGVAFSQTAARILSDLMAGEDSDLTRLFVVNHPMPYLGPAVVRLLFERLYEWYLVRSGEKTVR